MVVMETLVVTVHQKETLVDNPHQPMVAVVEVDQVVLVHPTLVLLRVELQLRFLLSQEMLLSLLYPIRQNKLLSLML